jgi:CRP/FNR family transcriptional regulator
MIKELKLYYGSLFEAELLDKINSVATFREVSVGQDLMKPGQYIKSMPLLLSGVSKLCDQMLMEMSYYFITFKRGILIL